MAYRLLNTGKKLEKLLFKTLKHYNVNIPKVSKKFHNFSSLSNVTIF